MGAGFGFGGFQLLSTCTDRAEILAEPMAQKWQYCCFKPSLKPVYLRLLLVYLFNCSVLLSFSASGWQKTHILSLLGTLTIVAKWPERIVVVWVETIGFLTQKHHQTSFFTNRIVVALRFGLVVTFFMPNHPSPASQRCHHHLNPSSVARKAVWLFKSQPHGTKCSNIHPCGR